MASVHVGAGQGLGKKRSGISRAIKVALKRDTAGVSHVTVTCIARGSHVTVTCIARGSHVTVTCIARGSHVTVACELC